MNKNTDKADGGTQAAAMLEKLLERLGIRGERKKQVKLLLLALLLGVIMMSFGSCESPMTGGDKTESHVPAEKFTTADEEEQLEQKLQDVLSKIRGVGEVSVSVTLASGSRTEYAVNASTTVNTTNESDADGSEKNTTQSTSSDTIVFEDNDESPVVVQESRPQVQGVLIVAEGGGDTEVCSQITAAVAALLDIPVNKITVCATD